MSVVLGAATAEAAGAGELRRDEAAVRRLSRSAGGEFKQLESRHYLVLYQAGQVFAESRAKIAERAFRVFDETFTDLGLALTPIERKLMLIVFRDHEKYVGFGERLGHDVARLDAFYTPAENAMVVFDSHTDETYRRLAAQIDAHREGLRRLQDQLRRIRGGPNVAVELRLPGGRTERMTRRQLARHLSRQNGKLREMERELARLAARQNAAKTMHEAAHQLAMNRGVQPRDSRNPLWVSEGLATQFEVYLTRSARKRGVFNRERLDAFRTSREAGRLLPLARVLTATLDARMPPETTVALYSQWWALFYYLRNEQPKKLGAYLTATADTVLTGRDCVTAFRRHFGEDLGRLDRTYVSYIAALK